MIITDLIRDLDRPLTYDNRGKCLNKTPKTEQM